MTDLESAERGVAEMLGRRDDRWYPRFHIAARAGWINDPNGLCHFNGRYHVYFQHNPYGPDWGTMHWGHVSSADLVTWRREPIAMAPELEAERDGVFSGSAVVLPDAQGTPTLAVLYTGHRWLDDGSGRARQVQCLATSTDGVAFTKHGIVIDCPEGITDFRDPKIWCTDGCWYMVVGAQTPDRRGEVWLYSCETSTVEGFTGWRFQQVLHRDPEHGVFMAECPDFFPLTAPDGRRRWVLTYCAMGARAGEDSSSADRTNLARYVVGDWAPGRPFTDVTAPRPCDQGPSYYASQSMETPDGRRLAIGWMSAVGGVDGPPEPPQAADGWCGQLTVPRELSLGDGDTLLVVPARELVGLRTRTRDLGRITLAPWQVRRLDEDVEAAEIELGIDPGSSLTLAVGLTGDGRAARIGYDSGTGRVSLELGEGFLRWAPVRPERAEQPVGAAGSAGTVNLRVLVDRGSVEVFADGRVISSTVFPSAGPRAIKLGCGPAPASLSCRIHRPASIWETPDR
ncbi:glycoside hydrolase family 32 protein [Acidipropionibacterium virtanenii]|uniref:beta-fructofuranosidase n=1 Tax=Acidipropionibacterium virtanenii TaxID=2057246 RepID=A0A344UQ63_9ACTN|nr:GH32 C-terminal domain-containing protein [Acidipropionibacterium virtanenii]AXE37411.1 Sucrose-6-phosphate hydrolase [Acidipropionibacterium virtanenii]